MSDQLTSDSLVADMRRKYQHARAVGDGNWIKGEPLTCYILERWIPQVEDLIRERDLYKFQAETNAETIKQITAWHNRVVTESL